MQRKKRLGAAVLSHSISCPVKVALPKIVLTRNVESGVDTRMGRRENLPMDLALENE